jgi:hypothetical protein
MPGSNGSYRVYRDNWVGSPYYPPSIATQEAGGQTTIYASWNGSTETDSWQVLGGTSPASLSIITTAAKSGFETAISVAAAGPYFQVKALGNQGQVLGISKITRLHDEIETARRSSAVPVESRLPLLLVSLQDRLGLRIRGIENFDVEVLQRHVVRGRHGGNGAEHPRDLALQTEFHRKD